MGYKSLTHRSTNLFGLAGYLEEFSDKRTRIVCTKGLVNPLQGMIEERLVDEK